MAKEGRGWAVSFEGGRRGGAGGAEAGLLEDWRIPSHPGDLAPGSCWSPVALLRGCTVFGMQTWV